MCCRIFSILQDLSFYKLFKKKCFIFVPVYARAQIGANIIFRNVSVGDDVGIGFFRCKRWIELVGV